MKMGRQLGKMLLLVVCLFTGMTIPGLASSKEIPRVDMNKICPEAAIQNGARAADEIQDYVTWCIEREQAAYNSLKQEWPQGSSQIKEYCLAYAGDKSAVYYTKLESCLISSLRHQGRKDGDRSDQQSVFHW